MTVHRRSSPPLLRATGSALLASALLAGLGARAGRHRSQHRAPRRHPGARGRAPDGDRPAGPVSRHRARRREARGSSSAGSTWPTSATGTSPATGAIPTACSTSISPPPPSSNRSASRWIRAWSSAGYAEVERGVILLESSGWNAALASRGHDTPPIPPYILELGANLLSSCPSGGVLLTGTDLESLSAWYGTLESPSIDVLLVRPDRYATDSLYRLRWPRRWAWIPRCRCSARWRPWLRAGGSVSPPVPTAPPRRRWPGCHSGWCG